MTVPGGTAGGAITINEGTITQGNPTGFTFFGQQVNITAPTATAANPLHIVFLLDSSIAGTNPADVHVFKNGVEVPDCPGDTDAIPNDPCITSRSFDGLSTIRIEVLTSTASGWNFGTPTTPDFHDAAIIRLRTVHNTRLAANVPDTQNTTVVVGQSFSNHSDPVSVYLAFNPPGGFGTNPGGCQVIVPTATAQENQNQVYNWTSIILGVPSTILAPGQKITLSGNIEFQCSRPDLVNGLNWDVKAIADVHADDFFSCDTLGETFNGKCNVGVNDDDDNNANNTLVRSLPKVVAQ